MHGASAIDGALATFRHALRSGVPAHRCGFFFDFDGTLAPIQVDPETVNPVAGTPDRLGRLAEVAGLVAVVSGRPASFLLSQLGGVKGARFFGLYGLETVDPDGSIHTHAVAQTYAGLVEELAGQAERDLPGVSVERKRVTLSLHYRVDPSQAEAVQRWAQAAAEQHGLVLQRGRMVCELKPPDTPTKGTVVEEHSAGLDFIWCFGDDIGDVAAFRALTELRQHRPGLGVVLVAVHNPESGQELESLCDLLLDSPGQIPSLLDGILEILVG